jgi:hypothetical protein
VLAAGALLGLALPLGAGALPAGAVPSSTTPTPSVNGTECREQSVATSVREAQAVFTGTVTARTEAPLPEDPTVTVFTQTVEVGRVYRGQVTSSSVTVQSERVRRQCSQGRLGVGSAYVFFVDGDSETWTAAGGGGTTEATDALVAEVEGLLGSGRAPTAPEREAAQFTEADVSAPVRFSRAAAPGLALVIVGLLGLLVAGRLSRRTA